MKMKKIFQTLIFLTLAVTGSSAIAQTGNYGTPYKNTESAAYGTDILIQGNLSEDQRNTKIVVAANGYLYSAYLISTGGFRVARSVDNGTTWTYSSLLRGGYYINAIDLAVTGANANSTNVWAVSSGFMKASIDVWEVTLEKLDQQLSLITSTSIDNMISNFGFPDVAIATDFAFPSAGAAPFSIGLIYSKVNAVNDNIIFKSSADGGNTFSNTQTLASSGHYYVNVALAFGRSAALPEGRYFAAWDKLPDFSYYYSSFGQVYTSHSLTGFNSVWAAPYQVDVVGGGLNNGAKDPSIACQDDLLNNSGNAFSVVVTWDKKLDAAGNYTAVFGAGNLNPVTGAAWLPVFSSGTGNIRDIEQDVAYDASHQRFYATWSDSLTAKLKCSYTGMNLNAGGSWTSFSNGYNDAANIQNPFPKVRVNTVSQQVVNVWSSQRSSTFANSTFDRSDYAVGTAEVPAVEKFNFTLGPNPCKLETNISFTLVTEAAVNISVFDLSGRLVAEIPFRSYPEGRNQILLNTSALAPACYLIQIQAGNDRATKRLIVTP